MDLPVASSAGLWELILVVSLAIIYMAFLRLFDLNEREPIRLIAGVFLIGSAVGLVFMAVDPTELGPLLTTPLMEAARFIAIALGFAFLVSRGHRQGWREVQGPMDGVIYGAAGGLGFAVGQAAVYPLSLSSQLIGLGTTSPADFLFPLAVNGLYEGLLGALIGFGLALALTTPRAVVRVASAIGGLAAAIGGAYLLVLVGSLIRQNASDDVAMASWVLMPILILAVIVVVALRFERSAITAQLPGELERGIVTADDIHLLSSVRRQQGALLGPLLRGQLRRYFALQELQNRMVQLALTKANSTGNGSAAAEIDSLRSAVVAARSSAEQVSPRRPRPALTSALLSLAVAAMMAGAPLTAMAEHRGAVTVNKKVVASPSQLRVVAENYAWIANRAGAACGSTWAGSAGLGYLAYAKQLGVRTGIAGAYAIAAWAAAQNLAGVSMCNIAKQSALAAAWAGYYWAKGSSVTTWLYIFQEDRHYATDVCHIYHSFGGNWAVWDMKTAVVPLSGGCPR